MRWISEHKLISILLSAILVAALILTLTITVGKHTSGPLHQLYTLIEKPMVGVGSYIEDHVDGIFSYRDVMKENDALREENERLKSENSQLALSANELTQLQELAKVLNYDIIQGETDVVTADVVTMDGTNWTNLFTINKGTESGIQENCIVMCGEGMVGRVRAAGEGWAEVVSLIDESSAISFKVEGNLALLGIIEGSADGTLTGYMLDSTAKVSEGDTIITSGVGTIPAGLKVGKIIKTGYNSDRQLVEITVKPTVEFNALDKVTVIL